MRRSTRLWLLLGGAAAVAFGLSGIHAKASGFDNTGIGSNDLLFDPAKFATEFSYTYQIRNVEYIADNPIVNKGPEDPLDPTGPIKFDPVIGGDRKAKATPNVWTYSAAAKFEIHEYLRCMARVNEPGAILEELPNDWQGRFSLTKTELTSFGLDGTCAIRAPVIDGGYFSLIGGARYIDISLASDKMFFLSHYDGPEGSPVNVRLEGSGFGWRAGFAFEYPELAIRANLFYDSAIEIETEGTVAVSPIPTAITTNVTMPQAVELRVQSGIAPRWLAFAGVKWVDWSVLDKIVVPTILGDSAKVFNFSDGWTVTAGVGHQLTDKIQVGSSLTWDQGIGGSYSDTYQWGLGGSYKINDNVTWSVGGALVYKTAADNEKTFGTLNFGAGPLEGVTQITDQYDFSYDESINFGLTTKLKVSF